ncbi:hypothetical protein ANN_13032 [Periplaneta americana]|uniref:THAP-type domain-containing protein n=1 Tax=Periplaneta americana TaxID=6978 RepID=A0ABQ8TIQ6_PERAM|nr:hypothetical protein ANN_13032 [Periplaneta americana]
MKQDRWAYATTSWDPRMGSRSKGRPRHRWSQELKVVRKSNKLDENCKRQINCPKTGLNLISNTNKASLMRQQGQEIMVFPFSRPHILHQWVAAVKREKWTPTKNSFLCSEHFTKESYEAQLSSGRWYLKEDAVPELFIYPERLHKVIKRRKPLIRNTSVVPEKKLRTTQDSVGLHSNSNHENDASSSDTLTLSSVRPPTTAPESPKKQVLKRKVKTLQQKLRRKNVRITTMKELLKELKRELVMLN